MERGDDAAERMVGLIQERLKTDVGHALVQDAGVVHVSGKSKTTVRRPL